jgi:hypothetical protein
VRYTLEERRMLLAYAFSNVTLLRGVETPEYTPAFAFMMEWMPKVNKSLEPAEKIAESIISSGSLSSVAFEMARMKNSTKKEIRTAKNGSITEPFNASQPELITLLPGQDSNLRPIDYTYSYVTVWRGLYHHRTHCCEDGARRFECLHILLPLGIVSGPSITFVKAWLLIALVYTVGVPAIHLVCNIDFSIRLLC